MISDTSATSSTYTHGQVASTGILLSNLGTPDAPTTAALRRYLGEFLWDPRVVEIPRPLWWLILNGFILPTRPRQSAKLYEKIWTQAGSPLLVNSQAIAAKLQQQLSESIEGPVHVELAMRYGNPSIALGLEKLRKKNVQRLLVLPLYPQYSATTTAAIFDAVSNALQRWRWLPELHMVNHYSDHPAYIDAVSKSLIDYFQHHRAPQKIIFSFHGIPKSFFEKGDPYYCYCMKTARQVAQRIGFSDNDYRTGFQSRFGKAEWLQPYTDQLLLDMAKNNIKHVAVMCPGFATDCLETLEEINMQYRELFLSAGGESFQYIPALNDSPHHIDCLETLVKHQLPPIPAMSK